MIARHELEEVATEEVNDVRAIVIRGTSHASALEEEKTRASNICPLKIAFFIVVVNNASCDRSVIEKAVTRP
jgi:hypothetical protein